MSWLRRLSNTFRPGRVDREIEREQSFHLAERADQLRADGVNGDEAARRARLQFGNPMVQRERTQDVDISRAVDALIRNLRHASRSLARTPGFTITVVLTLALGIGANTAVFSTMDAVLLRPLPFPDADRLVHISQIAEVSGDTRVSPLRLEDWNNRSSSFQSITGYVVEDVSDTTGTPAERVRRALVAPRFLRVWGIAPLLGRDFTDAEHREAAGFVTLISHRYWQQRLGADPNVVGKTVRMAERPYTVVGVLPPTFLFTDRDVDWWTPAFVDAWYLQERALVMYRTIGRLKAGATVDQARADLAGIQGRLGREFPKTDRNLRIGVEPLKDAEVGSLGGSLWLLFGAVMVLLLIACVNIAALLLSRGAQRRQEIAVRYSLGASRASVTAQLLTETGVLAVTGAAAGLVVAIGAAAAFRRLAPDLPRLDEAAIDAGVLGYTMAAATVVALLCGLFPALRSTRGAEALARTSASRVSGRHSLQWLLVGVQVTLSVTLLAGAGLLLRSFDNLSRIEPGFDPAHVLTFRVSGSMAEAGNYAPVLRRIHRTIDELAALPGVESAATASALPGVPGEAQVEFQLAEVDPSTGPRMLAESRIVASNYFDTMQIPIAAGEPCRRFEDQQAVTDVIVNRRFAETYVPARSIVGLHVAGAGRSPRPIVGVVDDSREIGIDREPVPTVYSCFSAPTPFPWYLVRTQGEPAAIIAAVRQTMHRLEPLRSVYDVVPLDERIGDAYAQNRLRTVLLVLFAVTALALTCLGVYGTLSYVVRLRRREIGLRLALGAARAGILRQFLGQGLRVAALACACGLALSFAFTRVLSGMLYGVSPTDPITLSAVAGLVLTVAALAALVPAARAAFVQPTHTLREE
jgi:putative ABC transport system permease protein